MKSMNTILVLASLFGCGDDSCPTTRYFATRHVSDRLLVKFANALYPGEETESRDWSAPAEYRDHKQFRLPWFRTAWWPSSAKKLFEVGYLWVRVIGRKDYEQQLHICGLHIGPGRVRGPFPIDFVYELFDDRELAERVRAKVGPIDIETRYEIETMVDGFRIRLAQDYDATIEIAIDGCGRVPQTREFNTRGRRIEFPGPTEDQLRP
jgi:hypothetical protein